jgi:hypothetical protein
MFTFRFRQVVLSLVTAVVSVAAAVLEVYRQTRLKAAVVPADTAAMEETVVKAEAAPEPVVLAVAVVGVPQASTRVLL